MSDKGDHHHKVRFDRNEETNEIVIEQEDQTIVLHLGFLKIKHWYAIEFALSSPSVCFSDSPDFQTPSNPNRLHPCVLISCKTQNPSQYLFRAEIFAHKERLLTEHITFKGYQFVFEARVLGKTQGTPLLKDGIHCIRVEDSESETSS